MVAEKKSHKNAQDSGGIAASVTKQTAGKFASAEPGDAPAHMTTPRGQSSVATDVPHVSAPSVDIVSGTSPNTLASGHTSDASSPSINTPEEFKPTHAPHYADAKGSPMLGALPVPDASIPGMNTNWARTGFATSAGNLISLSGESQPSSYEESGKAPYPWHATRPFMTPVAASPSPPNSVRRPLSFQTETQYQSSEPSSHSSAPGFRKSSLPPPQGSARQPPLPHQPQAHFYGAPNLDLHSAPQSGMRAGEKRYFFGFDRLPTSSASNRRAADDVIVAGYEGGLEIYSVGKKGIDPVYTLKGLRGGVFHAKILPWSVTGETSSLYPLIAVVLHGPVLQSNASETAAPEAPAASPQPGGTASPRSVFSQPDGILGRQSPVEHYQTSIQVYSLRTSKLVDVLLECPKIPISAAVSVTSPIFQPPEPAGSLTIKADAGTMVVCSGVSGECWVFLQLLQWQNGHACACAGKLWTTVKNNSKSEVTEDGDRNKPSHVTSVPAPILTLRGRWIAYCPAFPSSQPTVQVHIPVPVLGKAPGITSAAPPNLPASSAAVDLPISDSLVNKVMRETTQELIVGARWIGQQGMQAWNSYWNKPNAQSPPNGRSPVTNWASSRPLQADFPPTHGSGSQTAQKEPGIVSIVDSEALALSSSVQPLTTFTPPLGCSFLSFSPTALALFTASTKGDVQTVWDLFRIHTTKSSPVQSTVPQSESTGPLVRQIAQFSRMTVARIVDVAWMGAQGERLAMVTERGTVHLLDMPFSASMWPPPRLRRRVQEPGGDGSEPSSSAVSIASGAFGAAYQAAKPFVSRSRRGSAAASSGVSNTSLKDTAAQGGRVIAASISNSLGKTGTAINQLRNSNENRLPLPPSVRSPEASCIAWIRTRKAHLLFSIGTGIVRIFPSKGRKTTEKSGGWIAKASRYKDLKIPVLPDDTLAPAVRQIIESGVQEEYLDLTDHEMEAGNTVTLGRNSIPSPADYSPDAAIPQAEIESSAPYQPFHTDRRVGFQEYVEDPSNVQAMTARFKEAAIGPESVKTNGCQSGNTRMHRIGGPAWAFGQPIASTTVSLGELSHDDDMEASDRALPSSAMERVLQMDQDQEQIVVTTRRRRGVRTGEGDEDGFFEDDCEVLDFADQRV